MTEHMSFTLRYNHQSNINGLWFFERRNLNLFLRAAEVQRGHHFFKIAAGLQGGPRMQL